MRAPRVPAFVLVMVLLGSCASSAPPASTPPPAPAPVATPPAAAATKVAAPLPPGAPDTPVGHQLAWVVAVVNDRAGKVDVAEIEAHFHPSFLTQVPAPQAVQVFAQVGGQISPVTLKEVLPGPREGAIVARLESKGTRLRMHLSVEPTTGKLDSLLLQPDRDDAPRPATWDEALKAVPTLGERAQLLVAAVDKGKCKALHAAEPKTELAIGSTFKLYVLLGLVDQIASGKLTWETPLAIRDEWKSLPSGTMQDEAAGASFPIRRYAEQMISISDNTATDHILYTVGRKAVEAAVRASKHAKPRLDVPFLSTRELFLLKLGLPAPDVERFKALGPEARRGLLDGVFAGRKPSIEGAATWTEPRHIDTLEWFASSEDLCRVLATLGERARTKPKTAPVLDVLAKNPGLPVDAAVWPYVGFKGGSEPGVMNLSWLLRRKDDRWFVVTLGVNDTRRALDEGKILGVATGVLELLAKEP